MRIADALHSLNLKKAIILDQLHGELLHKKRNQLFLDLGKIEFRISLTKKQELHKVKNIV